MMLKDYIQPNNTYGKIAYLKNNLNQRHARSLLIGIHLLIFL